MCSGLGPCGGSSLLPEGQAWRVGDRPREGLGPVRLSLAFETFSVLSDKRVHVLVQEKSGYGEALRLGFSASTGDYIITLDCDLSHNPALISSMWQSRRQGEIVIASRYVAQGKVKMPFWRIFLSKALNLVLPSLLSIG